jgi:hypothetical protein
MLGVPLWVRLSLLAFFVEKIKKELKQTVQSLTQMVFNKKPLR